MSRPFWSHVLSGDWGFSAPGGYANTPPPARQTNVININLPATSLASGKNELSHNVRSITILHNAKCTAVAFVPH